LAQNLKCFVRIPELASWQGDKVFAFKEVLNMVQGEEVARRGRLVG